MSFIDTGQDLIRGSGDDSVNRESRRRRQRRQRRRLRGGDGIDHVLFDAARSMARTLKGGTSAIGANSLAQAAAAGDADLSVLTGDTDGLNADFAMRLAGLVQAVREAGGNLTIGSGFRTYDEQKELYAKYKAGTGNLAAKPGSSNHESGMAADLNGDLGLAAQLAPQFGLHFPVNGEPWHVEPTDLENMTQADPNASGGVVVATPAKVTSAQHLSSMFAAVVDQERPGEPEMERQKLPGAAAEGDLQKFLENLALHESGGNCAAKNPSGASGKYQFMQATWNGAAAAAGLNQYVGQDPASLPCEVQDQVAASYAQSLFNAHGTWGDVASVWYSGQPLRSAALDQGQGQYPTIREYVDRMRRETGLS